MKKKGINFIGVKHFTSKFLLAIALMAINLVTLNGQARIVPNDPLFGNQWYLETIMAPEAWVFEQGDPSVLVFVIDIDLNWTHEDLVNTIYNNLGEDLDGDGVTIDKSNNQWIYDQGDIAAQPIDNEGNGYIDDFIGWNFNNNNNIIYTGAGGHGTAVSGIIGANKNEIGIAGIADNCKIVPLPINSTVGNNPEYQSEINAINYAASFIGKQGVSGVIINCSWTTDYLNAIDIPEIHNAIINARKKGAILCFAAGNKMKNFVLYPARYQECIAVGGTDFDNKELIWVASSTDGSNYGPELDIAAPADELYTTQNNAYYHDFGGTSGATPQVSAAAALLLSQNPNLTPWEVQEIIQISADKTGGYSYNYDVLQPGHSLELGYGRLNILKALLSRSALNEIESNGSYGMANGPLKADMLASGNLSSTSDKDWYYFDVPSTGNVTIHLIGNFGENKIYRLYNSSLVQLMTGSVGVDRINTGNILLTAGRYYVRIEGTTTGNYSFVVKGNIKSDVFYEVENNNSYSYADGRINSGETVSGQINNSVDIDWYVLDVQNTGTLSFSINAGYKSWSIYSNPSGAAIATGSINGGPSLVTSYTISSAGKYYLKLSGQTGPYDFKISGSILSSFKESEYNNAYVAADGPLSPNMNISGKLITDNDEDWFELNIASTQLLTINLDGFYKNWSLYSDPYSNNIAFGSASSGGSDVQTVTLAAGKYYMKVKGYQGCYKISFTVPGGIIGNSTNENLTFKSTDTENEFTTKLEVYPNPFTDRMVINYSLETEQNVILKIYDASGRLVKTLVDRNQPEGNYSEELTSEDLKSGIYYCQLQTENSVITQKMAKIQ